MDKELLKERGYDISRVYIIPSSCQKKARNVLLKAFSGKNVNEILGESLDEEIKYLKKRGKHTKGKKCFSFVLKDSYYIDEIGIAYEDDEAVGHMEGYWDVMEV